MICENSFPKILKLSIIQVVNRSDGRPTDLMPGLLPLDRNLGFIELQLRVVLAIDDLIGIIRLCLDLLLLFQLLQILHCNVVAVLWT